MRISDWSSDVCSSDLLKRFAVERVIVVADRGLLSLDNVAELAAVAEQTQRQLQFVLAVPARRYGELGGTLEAMRFVDGQAEATFAEQRLVVAHDPQRATEQSATRRARIQALADFAHTQIGRAPRRERECPNV